MASTNKSDSYSTKISAKIWGHRFTSGQRGPEYILEFLNVISGTDYKLNENRYKRNKSIELRKFIFEGSKQGAKHESVSIDSKKKDKLYEILESKENVSTIREFLRNLEVPIVTQGGKLADRSWYAKTLYPLHESLLFFEVRVKGKSTGIERNFFARGGELYYLMISFGTENHPKRKKFIERRFEELLTKNNSIEKIVSAISNVLEGKEENGKEDTYGALQGESIGTREELPTLPIQEHPFFEDFARELEELLKLEVDVYEMFKLLTSLICFQLLRYMYEMAKINKEEKITMFFDCLDGQVSQVLKLSSKTFQKNEVLVKEKFEQFFRKEFNSRIQNERFVMESLPKWKAEENEFFNYMNLSRLHTSTKTAIKRVLLKCETFEDINTKLFEAVKNVVSDQLKKNQLSIIKILLRDGGIGNYKAGSKYRYTVSDTFLQILVFANIPPSGSIEFSEFLQLLFRQYGIVIGVQQAKDSRLYEQSRLNTKYFQENELALREKLKSNGLLVEYSDATAMIRNPYEVKEGVSV